MPKHARRTKVLLSLCLVSACTGSGETQRSEQNEEPGEEVATKDAAKGRVELRLPPGLQVRVDGVEVGVTPVGVLELEPGTHVLDALGPCGTASASVEAEPGAMRRVEAEAFAGLGLAKLRVEATTWKKKAVDVEVAFEGESTPRWTASVDDAGVFVVPACPLRMRVSGKDRELGGWIENVAFTPGSEHMRTIVLAPGSDVVRIAGGTFVSGPPAEDLAAWREHEGQQGLDELVRNVERTIATFELDRTEVTVAQYLACQEAGACKADPIMLGKTELPRTEFAEECNTRWVEELVSALEQPEGRPDAKFFTTRVTRSGAEPRRRAVPGREEHPMNCIAAWEAKAYCKWVGKRLPLAWEWEYAARSGKTEYKWPWGNDASTCRAHSSHLRWFYQGATCPKPTSTTLPCSYPEGNSEQGVCDLLGNVSEYVEYPRGHRRRGRSNPHGSSFEGWAEAWEQVYEDNTRRDEDDDFVPLPFHQFRGNGFRCARSVQEGAR